MGNSIQARVVAIDAAMVFVATQARIASFRRDVLPAEWWRRLRSEGVNGQVAALIDSDGAPVATPFAAVPALSWPTGGTHS